MGSIVDDYQIGPKSKDIAAAYDEQFAGPNAKIGRPPTLHIRFPEDYTIRNGPLMSSSVVKHPAEVVGDASDHGTFMVYNPGSDEMVPLTQNRLDELVDNERRYGFLVKSLRTLVDCNSFLAVNIQRHTEENAKYLAPKID